MNSVALCCARQRDQRRDAARASIANVDARAAHATRTAGRGRSVGSSSRSGSPASVRASTPSCRAISDSGSSSDAEQLALPERVVGVLHRQRRPVRRRALDPGRVGGHHVPGQRRHREAVGGDVVHHERPGRARSGPAANSARPQRDLGGDVEAGARRTPRPRPASSVRRRPRPVPDPARRLAGRQDHLDRARRPSSG